MDKKRGACCIALAGLLLFSSCSLFQNSTNSPPDDRVPLDVQENTYNIRYPEIKTIEVTANTPCVVYYNDYYELRAPAYGTVDALYVSLYDTVEAGDLLATVTYTRNISGEIDTTFIDLQFQNDRLVYEKAVSDFDKGLIRKSAYLRAEQTFRAQEAAYITQTKVSGTVDLYAPIAGTITQLGLEENGAFNENSWHYHIRDYSSIFMYNPSSSDLTSVRVHDTMTFYVYRGTETQIFTGTVLQHGGAALNNARFPDMREIIFAPDAALRQFILDNQDTLTQLQIVPVLQYRPDTLTIPTACLRTEGDWTYVYVLNDQNEVEIRDVTTGVLRSPDIEILSGLTTADRVVVR